MNNGGKKVKGRHVQNQLCTRSCRVYQTKRNLMNVRCFHCCCGCVYIAKQINEIRGILPIHNRSLLSLSLTQPHAISHSLSNIGSVVLVLVETLQAINTTICTECYQIRRRIERKLFNNKHTVLAMAPSMFI